MPKKALTAKAAIEKFCTDKPKASLRTMKEIVSEFDGIPTNIVDVESGNLNFDVLGRLIAIGVRQVEPTVTNEQVEELVDMDNLHEAMQAATNLITMEIPEGVIPDEMLDAPDPAEDTEGDSKNVA